MTRAHPDLWYPIAALLSALRRLLRGADPAAFAQIAREARAQLIVLTALVRRYIHVLAAEIVLPPPALRPAGDGEGAAPPPAAGPDRRKTLFQLIEGPSSPGGASAGEDPPALQWALLMEAAARLVSVMANPVPHARRLARRFGTLLTPGLRDLAVPWHVIRRISPAADTLLLRLDQRARPQAWAGMDTS